MITKFEADWDSDKIADFPLDYKRALDRHNQEEYENDKLNDKLNEQYKAQIASLNGG